LYRDIVVLLEMNTPSEHSLPACDRVGAYGRVDGPHFRADIRRSSSRAFEQLELFDLGHFIDGWLRKSNSQTVKELEKKKSKVSM